MGRQTVAGLNPFTIRLAPLELFKGISKITAEDLDGAPPLSGHADVRAKEKEALVALRPLYNNWLAA